jgi:hypothetical protein
MPRKERELPRTEESKPAAAERQYTCEFEQEFVVDTFQPLTAEDRVRWERAKGKEQCP